MGAINGSFKVVVIADEDNQQQVENISHATKVIIISYSILFCMNIRRYSSFQVKADAFVIGLVEEDELQVEACELLTVKADNSKYLWSRVTIPRRSWL